LDNKKHISPLRNSDVNSEIQKRLETCPILWRHMGSNIQFEMYNMQNDNAM